MLSWLGTYLWIGLGAAVSWVLAWLTGQAAGRAGAERDLERGRGDALARRTEAVDRADMDAARTARPADRLQREWSRDD